LKKIKTYQQVVPDNAQVSFEIKRMEEVYEKTKGQLDDPHRHDYYIVLIVKKGNGQHIIDFNEFTLADQQLYFVSAGQVHQLVETQKSYGYVITFSDQFLTLNNIDKSFIQDLYLFQENGYSPPLEVDEETLNEISFLAEQMINCKSKNGKFKYQALGAWLKLLLIQAQEKCEIFPDDNPQNIQAGRFLLKKFKTLLEEKYAEWHKVADYASALSISADHLNNTIKTLTGKNVKTQIQNRILLAAKRMLLFSNLTNKEIAYHLGYSEPSNFSQFFKKNTNLSPTAFKKSFKENREI